MSFELLKVECYEIKASLCQKANDLAAALMNTLMASTKAGIASVNEGFQQIFEQACALGWRVGNSFV